MCVAGDGLRVRGAARHRPRRSPDDHTHVDRPAQLAPLVGPRHDDRRAVDGHDRPDGCQRRAADDAARPRPVDQRRAVGRQRLPAAARRACRVRRARRRPARRRADAARRGRPVRARVGPVWPGPVRDLDHRRPRAAGRRRGDDDPVDRRSSRRRLRTPRARQGDGHLLRRLDGVPRARPAGRRAADRARQLACGLLREPADRDRDPGVRALHPPPPPIPAHPARRDRLARCPAARRRPRRARPRADAGPDLGLGLAGHPRAAGDGRGPDPRVPVVAAARARAAGQAVPVLGAELRRRRRRPRGPAVRAHRRFGVRRDLVAAGARVQRDPRRRRAAATDHPADARRAARRSPV
jgi:hypothetical protein